MCEQEYSLQKGTLVKDLFSHAQGKVIKVEQGVVYVQTDQGQECWPIGLAKPIEKKI